MVPEPKRSVLTFDVGGTNIRAGLGDAATGRLLGTARRPTFNFLTHPELDAGALLAHNLDAMHKLSSDLLGGRAPEAVVVGWPGPVAPDGTVLRSPTVFGEALDRPLRLKGPLTSLWPEAPVAVFNDLTAAGYAYVGRGLRDFCVFTVGSGIANKVFVDGRPILGPGGRGGELGHVAAALPRSVPHAVVPAGAHLGDVGSGRGTLALARRLAAAEPRLFTASPLANAGLEFDNEALVAAFHASCPFAEKAVGISAVAVARAVAGVHGAVGAETFVFTGGFATALGEAYRHLLVEGAARSVWNLGQDWDRMIVLGEDADGLAGGVVYAAREVLSLQARECAA